MSSRARPVAPRARRKARRSGPRRNRWGTISREDIIEVAAKTVRAGGYEQMSIRSLAAELGVAPMSLYRHIRDKDDLLGEVVDRLLAGTWRPSCPASDGQAWLMEAAARLRQFLVAQPAALHVYLQHPVVSPTAMTRMNAMMDVLRTAGVDDEMAGSAYGALHTYTIGFAALEASRSRWTPGSGDDPGPGQQLAAFTTTGQFTAGLRYLLQGISGHIAADRDSSH